MDTDKCTQKTNIDINGQTVENVNHFEYLGARIEGDGRSGNEIRRRLAIAKQKLNKMKQVWKGQNTGTKLRIMKACVFPIAIYGCEAWTPLKIDLQRIDSFEMQCYRKILRIPWTAKITNEKVRQKLKIKYKYLNTKVKKLKLSFFGHIKRHESLEKTILEGELQGKRGRGKPRRSWKDDIEKWLGMDVEGAGNLAQNRTRYRRCTRAATSQEATVKNDVTRYMLQW